MQEVFDKINKAYVNENNNVKAIILCEKAINSMRDKKTDYHPYPFNVVVHACIRLRENQLALEYALEYLSINPEDKFFMEIVKSLEKKIGKIN